MTIVAISAPEWASGLRRKEYSERIKAIAADLEAA